MNKLLFGGCVLLLGGIAVVSAAVLNKDLSSDPVSDPVQNENALDYSGSAPVYVTFFSHNEATWEAKIRTEEMYLEYREGLMERADLLAEYGVKWSWQSDLPVLEAIAKYDVEGAPQLRDTNGVNVLLYLESLGIDLDPHVHSNSMADVAREIELLGGTPTGVIGGARYLECGTEYLGFLNFVNWKEDAGIAADGFIHGEKYPDAKWKPEIFTGPAFGGHWFDDSTSGVWRPDAEDFYTHSPENDIIYIGKGYGHDTLFLGETHASGSEVYSENASYLLELVDKIVNKEVPTGTTDGGEFMYTASIHFRDVAVVNEGTQNPVNTLEGLKTVLNTLEPLHQAGLIEYVTYEEAAEIWQNDYNSVPYQLSLESFSQYDNEKAQAEAYCLEVRSKNSR